MKYVAILSIVFLSGVAAACSSATRASKAERCLLTSTDSAYLAGGAVYRDCAVDTRARVVGTRRPPDYRPSAPTQPGTDCYLAEVEFVVGVNGVPEKNTARVISSNDVQLAQAVLAVVPEWRYTPAKKDGVAVRQIVREKTALAASVVVVRSGQPATPPRAPNCPR